MQKSFSKWFEVWGHKQAFAGDPNSFCGSLDTILGGLKERPKNGGPFTLLICYKHNGQGFYKEYAYDGSHKLIIFVETLEKKAEKMKFLLESNRDNLSFVGERLKMDKETFINRFKKLPMIAEYMRMYISQQAPFTKKIKTELSVVYKYQNVARAKIDFGKKNSKEPKENVSGEGSLSEEKSEMGIVPMPKINVNGDNFLIQFPAAHNEDLLVEIKEKILEGIRSIAEMKLQENPKENIHPAFDSKQGLNHSLKFFGTRDSPLDDYMMLGAIVYSRKNNFRRQKRNLR